MNIICCKCNWIGTEDELIERKDDWMGELYVFCPVCGTDDLWFEEADEYTVSLESS